MANEFELIDACFKPLSDGLESDEIGIGDDGAVLNVPVDKQLVVVTDTLISGVHFPENASAEDIAWKAVAVNLSDLAAMGAIPSFFSLALTLPDNDADWLQGFAKGLKEVARKFNVKLIGGDTTKGHLTITVTAQGWVDKQQAVLRSGAQVGDLICVTNTIGDGGLGLKLALKQLSEDLLALFDGEQQQWLLNALNRPQPQVFMADLIKDYAHSAIDISDGLVADLTHIIKQSAAKLAQPLKASIELEKIPLSEPMQSYIKQTDDWQPVLFGGDDYQLCFTLAEDEFAELQPIAKMLGVELSAIGRVLIDKGVGAQQAATKTQTVEVLKQGKVIALKAAGYLHFS